MNFVITQTDIEEHMQHVHKKVNPVKKKNIKNKLQALFEWPYFWKLIYFC